MILLPVIFLHDNSDSSNSLSVFNLNDENIVKASGLSFPIDGKVKLYRRERNIVEELDMEEYIKGVVASEMPANFEEEALKAQAVAARTYYMNKRVNPCKDAKIKGAEICDSTNCQVYMDKEERMLKWSKDEGESNWNKIVEAVNSTQGKIITYNNEPINAFFHSNSGGMTETTVNVWGGTGYPYLQAVATAGEEAYSQYHSEVTLSKQTFIDKIKEKHSEFEIDFDTEDCIKVLEYTDGNRVKTIKIGNLELSGVEVRTILGLKSANFKITIVGDNINFEVIGYGHGVGMSQTGADSMAKSGSTYEDIIKHFYTGVEITDL